jgi:hypothetical protein
MSTDDYRYLGDSAYVIYDGYAFRLCVDDVEDPTPVDYIYLGNYEIEKLIEFYKEKTGI